MKKITSFDDCLEYVVKTGVCAMQKSPGWIPVYQERVCQICDKLRNASGQTSWYHATFTPFFVKFNRETKQFTVNGKAV